MKTRSDFTSSTNQGKSAVLDARNYDWKCFKCRGFGHIIRECPNQRVMIMRDDGEIVTNEEEVDLLMLALESDTDIEEEEEINPPVGLIYVV